MPSAAHDILRDAILRESRISCMYNGQPRELCPIVLGHSKGEEKVLAFQVGGATSAGGLSANQWKCMFVAKMRNVRQSGGPWLEGTSHMTTQTCVEDVELDINVHVRKRR